MALKTTMYCLVYQGHLADRPPLITRDPLLRIGRDPACQLAFADAGLSDRHAAIERRADGYYLCDLASATGVLVNGQRIAQQRLQSGDELEFGGVRVRFEIVHEPAPARRPFDPLFSLAALTVAALVLGQVVTLRRAFAEPRPAYVKVPRAKATARAPAFGLEPDAPEPAAGALPAPEPVVASVAALPPPAPAPAAPAVLNRKLRIVQVRLAPGPTQTRASLVVRAQVGERTLDRHAVAIAVQFARRTPATGAVGFEPLIWLAVPVWENFSSQSFQALFVGAPDQCAGCVVHTFYRGELQDRAAAPAALLELATIPPLPPPS